MKKRILIFSTILLALLMLAPAGAAHAAPNSDRTIGEGETVHEDLVIFGGSLVIEHGATVDGDVSVFGGKAEIGGDIHGDVAIFGGQVILSGNIDGDIVVFGGSIKADDMASVDGDCILVGGSLSGDGANSVGCAEVGDFAGFTIPAIIQPEPPNPPSPPTPPTPPSRPFTHVDSGRGFFSTVSGIAGQSLLMGLLALVIAYLTPENLSQVSHTLRAKPGASGTVGFLSAIAVPTLGVILLILSILLTLVCIGILGYPIVLAIFVAFAAGLIMGWVALGTLFGRRLARWLKLTNRSLPVEAVLGTIVLTLVVSILTELPWILGGPLWWLAAVLASFAGLGAVALTRFGTRAYPLGAVLNEQKMVEVLDTLPDDEGTPAKSPGEG